MRDANESMNGNVVVNCKHVIIIIIVAVVFVFVVVSVDFTAGREKKVSKAFYRHHFPIYCILEYCAMCVHMLAMMLTSQWFLFQLFLSLSAVLHFVPFMR